MNRAQRRQAERNDRRGIVYTPKVLPVPAIFDEFNVFDFPQMMLQNLKTVRLKPCKVHQFLR